MVIAILVTVAVCMAAGVTVLVVITVVRYEQRVVLVVVKAG